MTFQEIKRRLADHAEELSRCLLPAGRLDGGAWLVGSVAGEPGKSLRINLAGDRAGIWKDFASSEKAGDMLDLVAAVRGCDLTDAALWAIEWLGGERPVLPAPVVGRPAGQGSDLGAAARKIWHQHARPANGTIVETYLRSRGITCPVPQDLRYAPVLRHGPSGRVMPAMVAAVRDAASGEVVAIHRTFLRFDGRSKAIVDHNKMALGPLAGGAVRLFPATDELGLAEGIETALSAQLLFGMPVWAVLGTAGLERLVLPESVRHVTIFGDGDPAGRTAAQHALLRYEAAGREVTVRMAPDGQDWNDALTAGVGAAAR